jgi:tetratricopeptide (TPR) repeat protein
MTGAWQAAGSLEEQAAVRHLVDLGYEDPLEIAARETIRRRAQESQLNRAAELAGAGQSQAAIDLLESAVAGDERWTAGRHWLARAYFCAGNNKRAAELLHWLEVHGVEHAELALMRAALALKRRELNQALDWAGYAKCLQDPLPEADVLIGEIHLRRGQLDEAEAAFNRAATHAESASALAGLGSVALRRGELEVAADRFLSALERDMSLWKAHFRLGWALLHLNRREEARVSFATVARLQPQLAGPFGFLWRLCELEGDATGFAELKARASEVIRRRREARRLLASAPDRY